MRQKDILIELKLEEGLESSEAAVLAVQFGALAVIVIILTLGAPGQNAQSTPNFSQVYWGDPSNGVVLSAGQTNVVTQNASSLSALFNLAHSTKVSSVAASRLCTDPLTGTGASEVYPSLQIRYDAGRSAFVVTAIPTSQRAGWLCTYTISLTDSLSQTTTWVGTVQLK